MPISFWTASLTWVNKDCEFSLTRVSLIVVVDRSICQLQLLSFIIFILVLNLGNVSVDDRLANQDGLYESEMFLYTAAARDFITVGSRVIRILANRGAEDNANNMFEFDYIYHAISFALYAPSSIWTIDNRNRAKNIFRDQSSNDKALAAGVSSMLFTFLLYFLGPTNFSRHPIIYFGLIAVSWIDCCRVSLDSGLGSISKSLQYQQSKWLRFTMTR